MTRLDQIRKLAEKGLTTPQIAAELGVKYNTVAAAVWRNGIKTAREYRGKKIGQTTFSALKMFEKGMPVAEIAKRLERTSSNIYASLRRAGCNIETNRYSAAEDSAIRSAIEKLAKKLNRPTTHIASRVITLMGTKSRD